MIKKDTTLDTFDTLREDKQMFDIDGPVPSLIAGIRLMPADFGLPGEKQRFFLAVLPTGQCLRLSQRAHDVVQLLQEVPPATSYAQAAEKLATSWHVALDAQALQRIIVTAIAPYGLLAGFSGKAPVPRSILTFKIPLLPKSMVVFLARGLTWLYYPGLVIPISVGAAVVIIVFLKQLFPASGAASPENMAWAYLLGLVSVIWHEFGHATACRRYNAPTGAIGFGLYIIFPAFYTDVTGAWQLPRKQRVIVDLGGIYFQSMALLLLFALYILTGLQVYALGMIIVIGSIIFSLNPFLRFDGYWMLNDLLGLITIQRLQRAISQACIDALKHGRGNLKNTFRALKTNLHQCIPRTTPTWISMFLLLYLVTTNFFWLWFLIALSRWVVGLLSLYPQEVETFLSLLSHQRWLGAGSMLSSLIIPWCIVAGLASMLFSVAKGSQRLFFSAVQDRGKPCPYHRRYRTGASPVPTIRVHHSARQEKPQRMGRRKEYSMDHEIVQQLFDDDVQETIEAIAAPLRQTSPRVAEMVHSQVLSDVATICQSLWAFLQAKDVEGRDVFLEYLARRRAVGFSDPDLHSVVATTRSVLLQLLRHSGKGAEAEGARAQVDQALIELDRLITAKD